jgi:hypothetical protein
MRKAGRQSYLFVRVVDVTHIYLGPAADRFIIRQIRNHLNKEPEELLPKDLYRLIDWIRVAVSFLTDDSELVAEYIDELYKLAEAPESGKQ